VRIRAAADGFAALLAAHIEDLQARGSRTVQSQAARVLPHLVQQLRNAGVRAPQQVREEHLVRFALTLAQEGLGRGHLAEGTQAVYLGAVKRFFAFLYKRGHLLANPAHELDLPKLHRLPRLVLSEAQARRLMAVPFAGSVVGLRDRAILETLYGTGIRHGECRGLDLGDVDLAQGALLVRDGKGRKDRWLPVAGRALVAIARYLEDARPELVKDARESALFLSKYGTRLAKATLGLIVHNHGLAVKPRISAHVLRHTCATHLLQGGADVRHVQELLGHKSLQTTQLYTRVVIEDLRQLLARSHPRERKRKRTPPR